MNIFLKEHQNFLIQLLSANVDFMLIGGYAVIYHGYVRTTGDMDIWIGPGDKNKEKLIILLNSVGFLKEDIDALKNSDFTLPLAFHLDEPPRRIDFLTKVAGLKFEEAFENKALLSLGQFKVPVLQLSDLLANKLISGRMKDKADVEELQKILKAKKDK